MRRLLFSLPFNLFLLVLLFVGIGITIYNRDAAFTAENAPPEPTPIATVIDPLADQSDAPASSPSAASETKAQRVGHTVTKLILPEEEPVTEPSEPRIPRRVREQMLADPTPITLFYSEPAPPPPPPAVSNAYAPFGRMIRCKLVTSLESSNLATPLVAITLESVWNRGPDGLAREIIPAGIEVHGPPVSRGRTRDRLQADGSFVFVWRTDDEKNGQELQVSAVALTRDVDPRTGLVGPTDASAGIRGDLIESDSNREIRLFAAAFLRAAASAGTETTSILNPLTNQVFQEPTQGLRNAGISGVEAVLDEWASRIRAQLEEEGFYVAVPAGREFYLYIDQSIDLRNARRGGAALAQATTQPAR